MFQEPTNLDGAGNRPRLKGVSITAKTSTEVKQRWKSKTYKAYQVNLRKEEDAELIAFAESIKSRIGTSDIFRIGLESIRKEGL